MSTRTYDTTSQPYTVTAKGARQIESALKSSVPKKPRKSALRQAFTLSEIVDACKK